MVLRASCCTRPRSATISASATVALTWGEDGIGRWGRRRGGGGSVDVSLEIWDEASAALWYVHRVSDNVRGKRGIIVDAERKRVMERDKQKSARGPCGALRSKRTEKRERDEAKKRVSEGGMRRSKGARCKAPAALTHTKKRENDARWRLSLCLGAARLVPRGEDRGGTRRKGWRRGEDQGLVEGKTERERERGGREHTTGEGRERGERDQTQPPSIGRSPEDHRPLRSTSMHPNRDHNKGAAASISCRRQDRPSWIAASVAAVSGSPRPCLGGVGEGADGKLHEAVGVTCAHGCRCRCEQQQTQHQAQRPHFACGTPGLPGKATAPDWAPQVEASGDYFDFLQTGGGVEGKVYAVVE